MIIGITGTLGAGTTTVVGFLKEKGFAHYSVREFLAEEKSGDAVVEDVRCVADVEALRRKDGFVFWAVDADVEIRYARIVEKNGSAGRITFQDFVRQEEGDSMKQGLKDCIEMADVCFRNDWTVGELRGKVEKVLGQAPKKRPKENNVRLTWDEYFMEICRVAAKRGTCDKGRSGCVVVRDRQILVTGYVGSPTGLAHCDDVGHQMEDIVHEDGIKRSHCVRTTHAEQNAICQAAKLGISIKEASLYCKMEPCPVCAKMIINSGIRKVVCEKRYQSGAQGLLEEAGVLVEVLVDEVEKY